MNGLSSTLGYCPQCEATIPERALLARYEAGGWPVMYAECPGCGHVVHPR